MSETTKVNRPAPLKNVAAFATLVQQMVERRLDLPGMACFFGPSGYGKTKSAVYGANRYRAAYVECGQFTTAKSLLTGILKELGLTHPRGSVPDMIEDAVRLMAADVRRPLIVDEAHWVAHKRFVDLLRELHDKSLAPVILIGEEVLPKRLEAHERVHNRMLQWVAAVPCDEDDFRLLAKAVCPDVAIADDLARAIIARTRGNTRRIVVNLARAEERAQIAGADRIDLAGFGGEGDIIGMSAPAARRP